VARRLKRAPQYTAYNIHGKYSGSTLQKRFGTWNNVGRAFEAFASGKDEWADVLALCAEALAVGGAKFGTRARPSRRSRKSRRLHAAKAAGVSPAGFELAPTGIRQGIFHKHCAAAPVPRLEDRPVCGNPLDLPAMRNAPRNEMGVVLLFGMLAERLGFYVESARTGFPDCEAKRRLGPGEWQTVRIEFEYESRNFRDHGHAPDGCDLIICWVHNWEECQLEVLALRDFIAQFQTAVG
jgi:hypothetical protein